MKRNILFVCTGNMCRSPMAESIFRYKCSRLGLDSDIFIDSAGTGVHNPGSRPDSRAQKVARSCGILLSGWSRAVTEKDLETFHHIFVMDSTNIQDLIDYGMKDKIQNVQLIRNFDEFNYKGTDVPDPYRQSIQHYEQVFSILEKCCDNILRCYYQGTL